MEQALPFLVPHVCVCVCVMTLFRRTVTAAEVWTTAAEITMKEIMRCLFLWVEVPSAGRWMRRAPNPSAGFHFLP